MFHDIINLGLIGPFITFATGFMIFIMIPFLAANTNYEYRVLHSYLGICFSKLTYSILLQTNTGSFVLTSPSNEYGEYKIEHNDTYYYFDDNAGLSKDFYGGKLGYTRTDLPCIVTPRVCEAGEQIQYKHENDELETIESDKEREEVFNRDVVTSKNKRVETDLTIRVPKKTRLVPTGTVGPLMNNAMDPGDIPVIDSFVKESQSLISGLGAWEKANALVSFMIGFGAVVLGSSIVEGSSGGGGSNLPSLPATILTNLPPLF